LSIDPDISKSVRKNLKRDTSFRGNGFCLTPTQHHWYWRAKERTAAYPDRANPPFSIMFLHARGKAILGQHSAEDANRLSTCAKVQRHFHAKILFARNP
jgi:hypothetical protein